MTNAAQTQTWVSKSWHDGSQVRMRYTQRTMRPPTRLERLKRGAKWSIPGLLALGVFVALGAVGIDLARSFVLTGDEVALALSTCAFAGFGFAGLAGFDLAAGYALERQRCVCEVEDETREVFSTRGLQWFYEPRRTGRRRMVRIEHRPVAEPLNSDLAELHRDRERGYLRALVREK